MTKNVTRLHHGPWLHLDTSAMPSNGFGLALAFQTHDLFAQGFRFSVIVLSHYPPRLVGQKDFRITGPLPPAP